MFVRGVINSFILFGGLVFAPNILAQDERYSLIAKPRLSGDIRLRYQHLERDDFANDANALTLRFRGNAEFDLFDKTTILGEIEGSLALIDKFHSGTNGRSDFPFIPDPEGVELNRLQITSEIIPETRLTLGRQKIALDDWRFLGNFPFRQNDQTIDAFRLETKKFGPGILDIGYFNKVHRPLGQENIRGTFEGDSFFINYNVATPAGRLSAFHYAFGLESGPKGDLRRDDSTQTTGFKILGRRDGETLSYGWEASFAQQQDQGDNLRDYKAEYWLGEISIKPHKLTFKGRVEILGSDNGSSLQTPLGNLHRFHGLSDQFLQTPPDGLRDYSIFAGYDFGNLGPFKRVNGFARYHWFEADTDGRNYGEEINLSLRTRYRDFGLAVEYADYKADTFSADDRSLFLTAEFSF